jgi:26S proteasome regulatory subunit N6
MRYAGKDVEAMKSIAKAHEDRSLADFEKSLQEFKSRESSPFSSHLHSFTIIDEGI